MSEKGRSQEVIARYLVLQAGVIFGVRAASGRDRFEGSRTSVPWEGNRSARMYS